MRYVLPVLVITAFPVAALAADPFALDKPSRASAMSSTDKPLAARRRDDANACAPYGRGFVKVAGSDTCVKVGGAISVGVSGGR